MEKTQFTYYRIFNVAQFVLGAAITVAIIMVTGLSHTLKIVLSATTIVSNALFILLFYKSVITVEKEKITFSFGIGAIRIPIDMDDIKSCVPIDVPGVKSIGIFKRFSETLNKVKGVKAVELQFYSKESVLQLETKNPNGVSNCVTGLLNVKKADNVIVSQ